MIAPQYTGFANPSAVSPTADLTVKTPRRGATKNAIKNLLISTLVDKSILSKEEKADIQENFIEQLVEEYDKNIVKIPLTYFSYPNSVVFRILKSAFMSFKALKDIENKHYNIVANLAKTSQMELELVCLTRLL